MSDSMPNDDCSKVLIGRELSSVEFVRDYVQLRFNGPTLSAITTPSIFANGQSFKWATEGYRDVLCGQIGKVVSSCTTIPNESLAIEFEDSSRIMISLRPADYCAAEAAILDVKNGFSISW